MAGPRTVVLALAAALAVPAAAQVERSIVRIVVHAQRGDWSTPWNTVAPWSGSGTGFVIDGGRVLTNAHVVSDARLILLYLHGDPDPHEARVRTIGHDCDLALLEPVDPDLLRGTPALEFGGLPARGGVVETIGYPAGGERISGTRGVVSRIEVSTYSQTEIDKHLTVQTDAAINPGNSGGPVLQDGEVVGVAFETARGLENTGYFIPVPVVRHFLEDAADGSYDGFPTLGVGTATMLGEAARRAAGMPDGRTGVRIDRVFPDGSCHGVLDVGDVVLSIDGHAIANDGTVEWQGMRLLLAHLLDLRQVGERARLEVLHDEEIVELDLELRRSATARRLERVHDRLPRYFVYGGLVFVPVDGETYRVMQNRGDVPLNLLHALFVRVLEEPDRLADETVMLLRRLDHDVNRKISWSREMVVERVNGRRIHGLVDLVEAVESSSADQQVFEFAYFGRTAALDRARTDAVNEEILELYGVPRDRRL